MELFTSPITGNLIGIISLFVGIVGVGITVKTMKSAKRIEEELKEAKINALDKKRFTKSKEEYLKKLKAKRNAASKGQVLSYPLCNDVLSIMNDLRGYGNIISKKDMDIISQQRNKLQMLSMSLQEEKNTNVNLQNFDGIVAEVVNILSKGEYDL